MRMKVYPVSFILLFFIFIPEFSVTAQRPNRPNKLYPILFNYARNLCPDYRNIPMERRYVLDEIANYLIGTIQVAGSADLLIIGSNNATRSILAEVWARAASHYYGIDHVRIFSGGTGKGQIPTNTIIALEKAGFIIYKRKNSRDLSYEIKYSYNITPVIVRSKKYNDEASPSSDYGVVFVCPSADANLPYPEGSNFRTSLHYFDPVAYDQSEDALEHYLTRSREIATEMFYIFYRLKNAE
jgi:arsenate reductase